MQALALQGGKLALMTEDIGLSGSQDCSWKQT